FQAEDGIRDLIVTGVQTCALPICPAELRARIGIGYVPQGREIFPQLDVEENLRISLVGGRKKGKEIPERVFTLFPALKKMLRRRSEERRVGKECGSRRGEWDSTKR